jgi:hypothetical protein
MAPAGTSPDKSSIVQGRIQFLYLFFSEEYPLGKVDILTA